MTCARPTRTVTINPCGDRPRREIRTPFSRGGRELGVLTAAAFTSSTGERVEAGRSPLRVLKGVTEGRRQESDCARHVWVLIDSMFTGNGVEDVESCMVCGSVRHLPFSGGAARR